jgi:hypothetical protein
MCCWCDTAAVKEEWAFCPFVGGYDFHAFVRKNKEVHIERILIYEELLNF